MVDVDLSSLTGLLWHISPVMSIGFHNAVDPCAGRADCSPTQPRPMYSGRRAAADPKHPARRRRPNGIGAGV